LAIHSSKRRGTRAPRPRTEAVVRGYAAPVLAGLTTFASQRSDNLGLYVEKRLINSARITRGEEGPTALLSMGVFRIRAIDNRSEPRALKDWTGPPLQRHCAGYQPVNIRDSWKVWTCCRRLDMPTHHQALER